MSKETGTNWMGTIVRFVIVCFALFTLGQHQRGIQQREAKLALNQALDRTKSIREPFDSIVSRVVELTDSGAFSSNNESTLDSNLGYGRNIYIREEKRPDKEWVQEQIKGRRCLVIDITEVPMVWLDWCDWPITIRASTIQDTEVVLVLRKTRTEKSRYGSAQIRGFRVDYCVWAFEGVDLNRTS